MRHGLWYLVVTAVVILAVAIAGCTMPNTSGGAQSSSGSGNTGPTMVGGTVAPVSGGGNCPTLDAAHSWTGKWDTKATTVWCIDMRQHLFPPSKDKPDPWTYGPGGYGGANFPMTLTQTGCDVAGTSTIDASGGTMGAPNDCPITLTGKVDKDNVLTMNWKAYCNIVFRGGSDAGDDSGVFTGWMEPTGTTFIGTFYGKDPNILKAKNEECPSANGNWVGKRAAA